MVLDIILIQQYVIKSPLVVSVLISKMILHNLRLIYIILLNHIVQVLSVNNSRVYLFTVSNRLVRQTDNNMLYAILTHQLELLSSWTL